jgi:hypothetical protein
MEDFDTIDLATRRTRAEARKLEAEAEKLEAETRKFLAEQRKNELEAEALHRWRYFAFPIGFASAVATIVGLLAAKLFAH